MLPKIKCTFSVLKMETMFNPCLRFREFMHSYDFVTPIAVKTSTYSRSTQEFRYTSYGNEYVLEISGYKIEIKNTNICTGRLTYFTESQF